MSEFATWAPELPLLVIEGDQARRRWQWQLPDMPVKIANYELLNRDREIFESPDPQAKAQLQFDLVLLDESQRIKIARVPPARRCGPCRGAATGH